MKTSKQIFRLKPKLSEYELECGCDEAGRGALAGPVVAAAVILPRDFSSDILNDSKVLNENIRNNLREQIEKEALTWSVGIVSEKIIDEINILNASIFAMHKAIEGLKIKPEFIIVDGNRFKPYLDIPYQTVVKGDAKYMNIAAASILAKTHRDELMKVLHVKCPNYCWDRNKAYPTKAHRKAIQQFGPSVYHRKSFRLLKDPELPFDIKST